MVQEDVTPLPYIKFCSHTNCLKSASILGLNNVCTVWNIFLKHSRVYSLEMCRFISQLKILWFYSLEEGHLYMWIAESILCLLGLLCNCFINWNMILMFPKLWGTGQEHVFVFSWKLAICKRPLREENVIVCVQKQLSEPVYSCSWMSRKGCKIQSL